MSRKNKGWELEIHTFEGLRHKVENRLYYNGVLVEGASITSINPTGAITLEVPIYAFFSEDHASVRGEVKRAISVTEKLVAEEDRGPYTVTLKYDLGVHENSHFFGLSCGHRLMTKTGLTYRMGQDVECLECSRGHEQARTTDAVYNPPVERRRREVAYFFTPPMDPDGAAYPEKMVLSCGHVYECPDPKSSEAKCTNCF